MSTHHATECSECGEFSQTTHLSLLGPVCERCYQWELRAFAQTKEPTPQPIENWRETPEPAEAGRVLVGQP